MNRFKLLPALLFMVVSCSKPDPCADIVCKNGGTCFNGQCLCPPGFTGAECDQEKTPAEIVIIHVKIIRFPASDASGSTWDVFGGPDIYLVIKDGAKVLYTSPVVMDADKNQQPVFYPILSINPARGLSFELWDDDGGLTAPDFIGSIQGTIYRAGERFPDTVTIDCQGCPVAFESGLTYGFE